MGSSCEFSSKAIHWTNLCAFYFTIAVAPNRSWCVQNPIALYCALNGCIAIIIILSAIVTIILSCLLSWSLFLSIITMYIYIYIKPHLNPETTSDVGSYLVHQSNPCHLTACYICRYICICISTVSCILVCICVYTYIYIYTCIYIYIYIYLYLMCVHNTCVHFPIPMSIHTHVIWCVNISIQT